MQKLISQIWKHLFEPIFTQGRHWRNLLVKTKVCLVEVCLLAFFKCFFLLKLKFFFKNKPPEKITLRHIVYLHLSELLYMDL